MLLPVFKDLIKPQWRKVLEELKRSGGMPVADLARKTGVSYMGMKLNCEELMKVGYLHRTRLPRTEVGRPEIFYSLAPKADALFPQAGAEFTLDLLDGIRTMYGENAPEKTLFQYFQNKQAGYAKHLSKDTDIHEKLVRFAAIRTREGCSCLVENEIGQPLRIIEIHNPLLRIFERYPRAATMELRMIEQLLNHRVTRQEIPGGRGSTPLVVFAIE